MKKRKFIIPAIAIIAAALLLEGFILKHVNDRNADRTSKVLLDRVITVLDKNDESEEALIKSLKDDYIVRAKAVSYIIDAKPEVEYDVDELQKIAALISVDEIHLFDTKGHIYSGSVPKYFGYSFDSGEQIEYFKPMLTDKKLTMCQDVTPNTSEAKEMMYAITWNEAGNKMIQVGIEPNRLLNEVRQNEISAVVADMPVYKDMEILVADSDTKIVAGATDSSKIGLEIDSIDMRHYRCVEKQEGAYIVAVMIEDSYYQQGSLLAILIVGIYLTLASCCMVYMLSKVMKEKYEKEKFRYTSNTDELTRCYNRRAYEEDINKLDLSKEWVYISMDINGLKRANDSFGHVAGDELIRAAADCMKNSFSEHGKVYRVGGDEFVVIITKDIPQFENILRTFEQRVASWHGEFVESMAVSYFLYEIHELSDEELQVYNGIGKEFLQLIETTDMQKVYKMPILYGFYNDGNVRMAVTEDEVIESWKRFFNRGTNWKDFPQVTSYEEYRRITDKQHLSKAKSMPIKFLKASGKGFFIDKDGYALGIRDELADVIKVDAFKKQMKDIIEYRTMEYYRRRYVEK